MELKKFLVLIMSIFIDNNFRYPEDDIGLTIINGDIAKLELMIQHLKELKEIITKKMTKNQIKDVVEQPKSTTRYRPKSTQQIDDLDEPVSKTQPVEQPSLKGVEGVKTTEKNEENTEIPSSDPTVLVTLEMVKILKDQVAAQKIELEEKNKQI